MSRFIDPVPQYRLDNDKLASSGLMEFYENKNYSTKKDTYADPGETIKNTNPLKLDGQGRMPPCFGTGLYSVKLYAYDNAAIDKKGELQWTRDDVDLSSGSGGAFNEWSPVQTYRLGDIVKDNGQYYVLDNATTSKADRPSTTPTKWGKTINIKEFTPGRSYPLNETVSKAGRLYQSNEANNTTEPPGAKWNDLSFNNAVSGDFSVSGSISSLNTVKSAFKPINTSRSSTALLAKDPHLSVSGLANSSWYKVQAHLLWFGAGSTTNGIAVRVGTTSATVQTAIYACTTNVSGNANIIGNQSNTAGFGVLPFSGSGTYVILIDAVVSTSSSGDPEIFIEWSQRSSEATPTVLAIASNITAQKI